MVRKKQTIFIMLIYMLLFMTACADTTEANSSEEMNNSTEVSENNEQTMLIEQPVVGLQNMEQGVLVTWDAIPNAEGYIVYSKVKGTKFSKIATINNSSTVEYLDVEAPAGTEYFYTVRAYVGERKSTYESVSITTGIWQPEVKVTYSEPKMKISWNQITGVDGYYVYRKEEGGKYSRISTIKDAETVSYIDEEITSGKIYTYAVRAYIGANKSSFTGVTCVSIGKPIVEVKDVNGGIEVSWNEIEGAEGYYVYRKEEGGKYNLIQKIKGAETTSYSDTDLAVGTKYLYAVRAYLGKYKSSYSAVDITADLGRVTVLLEASDAQVLVKWNEVSAAEGYYIYRKAEGEEEYTLINTIDDSSIVSYTDQQVEGGKTYYYTVRAFLGDEQSNYSGAVISTTNK